MEAENREGKEMNKKIAYMGQGVNVSSKSFIVSLVCLSGSLQVVIKPLEGVPHA